MKNSIANIPFLKMWVNYFLALKHKAKAHKLKIGHNNEIRDCQFGSYNALGKSARLSNVSLGDCSYVSYESVIRNASVGKFCSIGPRCQIGLGMHPTSNHMSSHPIFYSTNPPIGLSFLKENSFKEFEEIIIGNDVWIGASAIIMDGVKIGDGAIIAAGAVVTNDVLPFSIVKGVPAKHTRYRFSQEEIEKILSKPWWNNTLAEIKESVLQDNKQI